MKIQEMTFFNKVSYRGQQIEIVLLSINKYREQKLSVKVDQIKFLNKDIYINKFLKMQNVFIQIISYI